MRKQFDSEQIMFTGGGLEVLRTYSEKMKEYETQKAILQKTCTSCEEYERKIQALMKELGL